MLSSNTPVLSYADLPGANLSEANFYSADLPGANLSEADLSYANLFHADLSNANLQDANLCRANLTNANLSNANLQSADLRRADLTGAVLRETDFTNAILSDCKVYSAAVWDMTGEPKEQKNLVISRPGEPDFTVDNLEVAHFIYMIRHHKKLREVIRESTSKVVLILGHFNEKRFNVLQAVHDELRTHVHEEGKAKYIPVMFDFPPALSRDLMETVQILVGLSRFVIADISDPSGVLVELTAIVPHWDVPVKLIVEDSRSDEPVKIVKMLDPLTRYRWIDDTIYVYRDMQELCHELKEKVVDPLEEMVKKKGSVAFTGKLNECSYYAITRDSQNYFNNYPSHFNRILLACAVSKRVDPCLLSNYFATKADHKAVNLSLQREVLAIGTRLQFVHLSDSHLGYRQYGLKQRLQDWTRATPEIVNYAIKNEVDFVLHSGDLFNSNLVDHTTLIHAIKILNPLKEAGIPFFVIDGNHDRRKGSQSDTANNVLKFWSWSTIWPRRG